MFNYVKPQFNNVSVLLDAQNTIVGSTANLFEYKIKNVQPQ